MGNALAYRGRLTPAVIVLALLALAVLALGFVAGAANAQPTFEPTCVGCHSMSAIHGGTTHAKTSCGTCHTVNTATPPLPSACASCHGAANILAKATHTAQACGSTPGCHGAPAPTPTPTPTPTATAVATTVSLKASPAIFSLGKSVKLSGKVTPIATLSGKMVTLKIERKVGTKWTKVKTTSRKISTAGAYSWSYKPLKKGAYRASATIAKTAAYKASKSPLRTFKVK